jgi:3-oxoacyl-[acyl-carrier-protein] synthase-3
VSPPPSIAGREVSVSGARIAGVVSCLPSRQVENDYFHARFGAEAVNDVVKMIGVQRRHWTSAETSTSDLCLVAGRKLLKDLGWDAASVDAIVFVSQTPDFRLPSTACTMQAAMGLPTACIAFDVNLGCSGYPYALWLGMTMIATGAARRVLLAVGDTVSKIVDPDDRATALLFGDAGTMTALEREEGATASFVMGSDGRGATNLIVPHGGFKALHVEADDRMRGRNPACLFMDGGEVFNFTLRAVPALVARTLDKAGVDLQSCDAFLFHQANLFMLRHLSKKLGLPASKVPVNIDRFGNTSSASIPLLMTTELATNLKNSSQQIGMFGFGVGYSWAGAALRVGPLVTVETVIA